jgi:hypothetical protein
VLQTSSGRIENALRLERSTNLHQLARDPVRVLFSSAFWVGGFGAWVEWFILLSLFVAPVERWIGTARTALVFVIGHVGATLITASGLSLALRSNLVESSVVDARDVGASYGFAAVVALLAYRFRRAPRLIFTAILLAGGGQVALDRNFTNARREAEPAAVRRSRAMFVPWMGTATARARPGRSSSRRSWSEDDRSFCGSIVQTSSMEFTTRAGGASIPSANRTATGSGGASRTRADGSKAGSTSRSREPAS